MIYLYTVGETIAKQKVYLLPYTTVVPVHHHFFTLARGTVANRTV